MSSNRQDSNLDFMTTRRVFYHCVTIAIKHTPENIYLQFFLSASNFTFPSKTVSKVPKKVKNNWSKKISSQSIFYLKGKQTNKQTTMERWLANFCWKATNCENIMKCFFSFMFWDTRKPGGYLINRSFL